MTIDASTRADVIERLTGQFAAGRLPIDLTVVKKLVGTEYDVLAQQARISTYIPVLVEARVRRHLRRIQDGNPSYDVEDEWSTSDQVVDGRPTAIGA